MGLPEVGEAAPDFELPDSTGARWRLSERVAGGPVILVFYRGYW
jgi:peroxiredoxin